MKISLSYICVTFVAFFVTKGESTGKICPDQSQCVQEQTCCQTESGRYGCCPFERGICCPDKLHCCPENTICDDDHSRCVKRFENRSVENNEIDKTHLAKTINRPFNRLMFLLNNRIKNQAECNCGNDQTCCNGSGCCNLPNAVCCSDGKHCCPQNSECVFDGLTCLQKEDLPNGILITESSSTLIESNSVQENKYRDVPCPGGRFKCPDNSTCCSVGAERYGCCPMPRAVCCSDQKHCCPEGYTCDLAHNRCTQGTLEIQAAVSLPAIEIGLESEAVICPGGHKKCPDNSTCCEESAGHYGCCPYPQGVCCSDKRHCCPNGTSCDLVHMRCVKERFDFQTADNFRLEKLNKDD